MEFKKGYSGDGVGIKGACHHIGKGSDHDQAEQHDQTDQNDHIERVAHHVQNQVLQPLLCQRLFGKGIL